MSEATFQLSHSKLRTFDRCRKQYWYRYVSGYPAPEQQLSPGGIVGVAVHRAMKALADSDEPDVGAAALDAYLRMPVSETAGPGTEGYADALRCYEAGCLAHASIEGEYRRAEMDTWVHWRGIALRAKTDRADRLRSGVWLVIDWKTGRGDLDEVLDDQLDIAHLGLRRCQRLAADTQVRAIAWNLRTGHQRMRELGRRHAAGTLRRFAATAGAMQRTTEFEANPSAACRLCEWRDRCDEAESVETEGERWLEGLEE